MRITYLPSRGFRFHPRGGIQFEGLCTTKDHVAGQWVRYGQSKVANILYAAELARRYLNLTTVSIHPGIAHTGPVENMSFLMRAVVYVGHWGNVKTLGRALGISFGSDGGEGGDRERGVL